MQPLLVIPFEAVDVLASGTQAEMMQTRDGHRAIFKIILGLFTEPDYWNSKTILTRKSRMSVKCGGYKSGIDRRPVSSPFVAGFC